MKLTLSILVALLLVAPCIAMTDPQAAYLKGFQAGYNMRALWQDDVVAYNEQASAFNASLSVLNDSEAAAFMLPLAAERIAPVPALFNPDTPIGELHR